MDIIYIITYKCNLRCNYCLVKKNNKSISRKIIDSSLFLINEQVRKIRFFGGEPLLEYDTLKYLVKRIKEKNNDLQIILTTNAILLDQSKIDWIRKNGIQLIISLDGNEFTQLKNRKGEYSYKTIIGLLEKLPKKTIFNFVVAPNTVKYFAFNFQYLLNLGITRFNLLPAYYNNWTDKQLDILEKNFLLVSQEIKKIDKNIYLQNIDNYSELSFFNQALVIDYDGKLYNSTAILAKQFADKKSLLQIGDLNERDFQLDYKKLKQGNLNNLIDDKLVLINQRLDNILNRFIDKYKKYYE